MRERFVCLGCRKTSNSMLKLMPCLHLYCCDCLEKLINENSIVMPRDIEQKCSIFPCSECGYVVRVINNDTDFFKSVQFEDATIRDCIVGEAHFTKILAVCNSTDEAQHQACCQGVQLEDLQQFCSTCQMFVCAKCLLQDKHEKHDASSSNAQLENKRLRLLKSCIKMKENRDSLHDQLHVGSELRESLLSSKGSVEALIEARAHEMNNKINSYKNGLLSQLESVYSTFYKEQDSLKDNVQKDLRSLDECLQFCIEMLQTTQKQNFANISEELSVHVNRMLAQKSKLSRVVNQFKLEDVDACKEDLLIEKLFGTLVVGSISRISPHLASKYHTDMAWPCCLATNAKDFMMAGKLETFSGTGRLLFSDRDMKNVRHLDLSENCLPLDVLQLHDDILLLTTNDGDVSKFTFQGTLVDKWKGVFEGPSGQLAHFGRDRFLVTTTGNRILVCNSRNGEVVNQLLLSISSPVRCLITGNKLMYCILEDSTMKVFDLKGFPIESGFSSDLFNVKVKCPSSLVCDPFGNILVSDFTSDSILFFDRAGRCLGTILDKESDSITCPNRMMLDSCGNLYVAQYGGDICIFDYLSCAKKV